MTVVYEHPEQRRKVLTVSGETMLREEAEALGHDIAPYADLLKPSERIATRHPEHSDLAVLPPFGIAVQQGTARNMGFTTTTAAPRVVATPSQPDPKSAWRSSIYALSEARDRPAATAELLTSRTPETLTSEQAKAFLRGLPTETETTEQTDDTMTTDTDPKAARLEEIRRSANAFNRSRGFAAKDLRASIGAIEPAKLKRLAEIRYSALCANGKGYTHDAKAIRAAIATHDSTGAPLDRTLAQLGVDVAAFLPKV